MTSNDLVFYEIKRMVLWVVYLSRFSRGTNQKSKYILKRIFIQLICCMVWTKYSNSGSLTIKK